MQRCFMMCSPPCHGPVVIYVQYRQIFSPRKFRRHRISKIFLRSRNCVFGGPRSRLHRIWKNVRAQKSLRHRSCHILNRSPKVAGMSNSKEIFPRSQTPRPRSSSVVNDESNTPPAGRGRDHRLTINFLAHGSPSSTSLPAHMQQYTRNRTTSNVDPSQLRRAPATASSRLNPGHVNTALNAVPFDPRGRSYHLEVIQHPERSAEFGSAMLSRLPLAPPLIVQLIVRDTSGTPVRIDNELPFLIAHLSLYSGDGSRALDVSSGSQRPPAQSSSLQLLYGTLVSSPHCYRNMQGHLGHYFIFPDVSVRMRGQYSLMVKLMRLSRVGATGVIGAGEQGTILATAMTRPFEVVSQTNYTAPPLTPLTQYFLQQGAGMQAFASSAQNPRPQF